jgi:hypothetical protein
VAQRPNLLLLLSTLVYLAAALPLLFAPQELLAAFGAPTSTLDVVLLQVIGSAVFGFAMLNWAYRFSMIGGIYGRPVVIANLAHAASAALLLAPIARRTSFSWPLAGALAVYGVLAVAFGWKFFAAPKAPSIPPAPRPGAGEARVN